MILQSHVQAMLLVPVNCGVFVLTFWFWVLLVCSISIIGRPYVFVLFSENLNWLFLGGDSEITISNNAWFPTIQSCFQVYRFTLQSKHCLRHFPNVAKLLKVYYILYNIHHCSHQMNINPELFLSERFWDVFASVSAQIVMDRVSDRSKGFGFVTFASKDEAQKALMEFNGQV